MCIFCESMKKVISEKYTNVIYVRRNSTFGVGIRPDYFNQTKEEFDKATDELERTLEKRCEAAIEDIGIKLARGYYDPHFSSGMTFPGGV